MLKKFTAACSLITACVSFPAHAQSFDYTETFLGDGLIYQPLDSACRITDSRLAASGALANGTTRTLTARGVSDFTNQGGRNCSAAIPATAEALMATVTLLPTTGAGFLKVMPNGTPWQQGGTVQAQGTNVIGLNSAYGISNDMVIKLKPGAAPHMDAYANTTGNPVHFIIDVSGYFYRRSTTCTGMASALTPIAAGATVSVDTPACAANFALGNGGCEVFSGTGVVASAGLRVTAAPANKPFWRCQIRNTGATPASAFATGVCCNGN